MKSGFLVAFADRGKDRVLPGLELALGQGPVAVLRPMHDEHLGDGVSRAKEHHPGGANEISGRHDGPIPIAVPFE